MPPYEATCICGERLHIADTPRELEDAMRRHSEKGKPLHVNFRVKKLDENGNVTNDLFLRVAEGKGIIESWTNRPWPDDEKILF